MASQCVVVSHVDIADADGWQRLEAQVASRLRAMAGLPPGAEGPLAAEAIALRRGEVDGLFAVEAFAAGRAEPAFRLAVLLLPPAAERTPEHKPEHEPEPVTQAPHGLPEEVEVACGELRGVLVLRNVHHERFDVRMPDGRVLKPTQFEAAAGRGRQKKWRKNVIVVSTGETAEVWLRRHLPRVQVDEAPGVA